MISPTQRPVLDNTQHLQETNIYAPGGISNPQSQQARGRRPTPLTARPLGSSLLTLPPGKYNLLVTRLQCDWGLLSCIAFGTNDKCVSGSSVGIATDYGLEGPGSNPGGARFSTRPDRPWSPPSFLYNGYRVFPGGKVRTGRAADHSPPSSAAVMEEQTYNSSHPLGHTGPVTGSLYFY